MGRTSRGHPRVIRADIPAQNFGQGGENLGKNKHRGADIHDPKARTSMTLRDFQKLRSEKLWAEFRSLLTGPSVPPRAGIHSPYGPHLLVQFAGRGLRPLIVGVPGRL